MLTETVTNPDDTIQEAGLDEKGQDLFDPGPSSLFAQILLDHSPMLPTPFLSNRDIKNQRLDRPCFPRDQQRS